MKVSFREESFVYETIGYFHFCGYSTFRGGHSEEVKDRLWLAPDYLQGDPKEYYRDFFKYMCDKGLMGDLGDGKTPNDTKRLATLYRRWRYNNRELAS